MTNAEIKVMKLLWKYSDLSAKNIAAMLGESIGWKKNTTYTVIQSCIRKGYIKRTEPHFMCHALVREREAQQTAIAKLTDQLFEGSPYNFFTILGEYIVNENEDNNTVVKDLQNIVEKLEV